MNIEVSRVEVNDVTPLQELYRQETMQKAGLLPRGRILLGLVT